ncbi:MULTISPECIES: hypothetical protein [Salinibaculum]|uniref:hypothetical protein n=1 Tax=Salinibaculum TaxID=2732368 RepID=UPI0030CAF9F4
MVTSRQVVLIAILVLTVTLVSGTSGVTSMTADRDLELATTGDLSAYLTFEQSASGTANGTTNLTVALTNQFPSGTTLTGLEVTVDGQTTDMTADETFDAEETGTARFESVECGSTITVVASTDGLATTLTRTVDCPD